MVRFDNFVRMYCAFVDHSLMFEIYSEPVFQTGIGFSIRAAT